MRKINSIIIDDLSLISILCQWDSMAMSNFIKSSYGNNNSNNKDSNGKNVNDPSFKFDNMKKNIENNMNKTDTICPSIEAKRKFLNQIMIKLKYLVRS